MAGSARTPRTRRSKTNSASFRPSEHVSAGSSSLSYTDEGVSGAKGRDKRPGFDALLKGVARREFDLIAAWSVCRLGRSLQDLIGFLAEIQARSVDLYLHQQALDTSTPSGRAMFQLLGVFAEFERAMIRSRVVAGLNRVRGKKRHHSVDGRVTRSAPDEVAVALPGGKIERMRVEPEERLTGAAEFGHLVEDKPDRLLDPAVRIGLQPICRP